MGIRQVLMAGSGLAGTLISGLYTNYGTYYGYAPGTVGGTISPTTFMGHPIAALEVISFSSVQVTFSVSGSLPNGVFTILTINGMMYPASAATYSTGSGFTTWSWAAPGGSTLPISANGQFVQWSLS